MISKFDNTDNCRKFWRKNCDNIGLNIGFTNKTGGTPMAFCYSMACFICSIICSANPSSRLLVFCNACNK